MKEKKVAKIHLKNLKTLQLRFNECGVTKLVLSYFKSRAKISILCSSLNLLSNMLLYGNFTVNKFLIKNIYKIVKLGSK